MDAKELRIGNYVYDRHAKEIEKVTPMWITYQDYWQKHDDKKCLKPIPITEDILLRLNQVEDILIDKLGFVIFKNGYAYQFVFEDYPFLHQLQNLFFALSGEELKLKEQ